MNFYLLKWMPWIFIGTGGMVAITTALRAMFLTPEPVKSALLANIAVVALTGTGIVLWNRYRGIL